MSKTRIILGTRGSDLALTQTRMVAEALQTAHPHLQIDQQVIQTSGDQRQDLRFSEFNEGVGVDKGIFIKELETALNDHVIDAAVHSLKDVPSDLADNFTLAAVLPRAAIEDVLITRAPHTLEDLPAGARVGTSSVRRAAQLRFLRPDLEVVEIRGNVPTRLRKLLGGDQPLDAVLLAAAGLLRLGLLNASLSRIHLDEHTLYALVLNPVKFLPAAGQGTIAIECRASDKDSLEILRCLNDPETEARIVAEREFLSLLGAGCQTPVGAHTWVQGSRLHMSVRVFDEKNLNARPVDLTASAAVHTPKALALMLARRL